MEKCPACGNYSVADSSQGKRCYACSVRIYEDGSHSRIEHHPDAIKRVRKYIDGKKKIMKEFAHP